MVHPTFLIILALYAIQTGAQECKHCLKSVTCAVTEPPTCLAVSVAFALREAIVASREDTGYSRTEWFEVDGPFTLETNVIKAETNLKEYLFE